MANIVSFIEKFLGKPESKAAHATNDLFNGPMKAWGEVISGGNSGNRIYNKANLWVVFNRFDMDAPELVETSGEYPLKSYDLETTGLLGNS
jgi:hypothetical protein